VKINNFFSNCMSCLSEEEVAGRYGLGVMFLPGRMWVYCEFLSSEGISAGGKMIKGFANAEAIHLMDAVQVMIKCLVFPVSCNNVGVIPCWCL